MKYKEKLIILTATEKNVKISFASGWAVSSEYIHCTMLNLFDEADKYMYENKQKRKLGRQD